MKTWEEELKNMSEFELINALSNFVSPEYETSLVKGIPMHMLGDIKKYFPGKFRYKYRGPSTATYKRPQSHTTEEFATSFAIYEI